MARISDTLNNAISFKYEQRFYPWGSGNATTNPIPGREWNLLEVQYGKNKVIFNYDPTDARTDKSEAYHLGFKNVSARLLNSITTYTNANNPAMGATGGTAVKTTKLGYELGTISKRSRIASIKTCAGDGVTSPVRCTPATTFTYANGGDDTYVSSTSFPSSLQVESFINRAGANQSSTVGLSVGDFNGDGKTDFIRWSDDPTQNKLYFSNGDGSFTSSPNFNLKSTANNLFKSDQCYYSIVADLNSDGLPDIFRFASNNTTTCPGAGPTTIYLNNGDGSFTQKNFSLLDSGGAIKSLNRNKTAVIYSNSNVTVKSPGSNFYILDANGDGILDIVTTVSATTSTSTPTPSEYSSDCNATTNICNRVYYGDGTGNFAEKPAPLLVSASSLFIEPQDKSILTLSNLADLNGDGLVDIFGVPKGISSTPIFVNNGDGTFTGLLPNSLDTCIAPIDFNGDGRSDCLWTSQFGTQYNALGFADGSGKLSKVAGFNLTNPGQELDGIDGSGNAAGLVVADINGDGRQDIIRWKSDASGNATGNALFLSNGDGTFTSSSVFATVFGSTPLRSADGLTDFVLGDFTGKGNTEILRLRSSTNGTNTNQLYIKADTTPADQLTRVTNGTGLKTILTYMPISNSNGNRYTSDRVVPVNPGAPTNPNIDLTIPIYVVTTMTADTGVGANQVVTEYAYAGLKADTRGRGSLGFREVRRQSTGTDGTFLTTITKYVQKYPYVGVAASSETRRGTVNDPTAQLLSSTVNTYCDTSVTNVVPTETAPCAVTAKILRPYLYKSTETGYDLLGLALPTVVTENVYTATGDPQKITVTTTGTSAGIAQTTTKVVDNIYFADSTVGPSGDDWILGRLQKATVTNTVPDLRSLTTSAGTGNYATAISGSGPILTPAALALTACVNSGARTSPTPATYTCTVSGGPSSCAANTANCGSVVVTSSTNAGTYTGTLTATPNAGTSATSNPFTLTVNKVDTSTTLTFSPSNPAVGATITYTASVSGSSPSGTVIFYMGGTQIGTATVSSGQAVYVQSGGASAGTYSLTASYQSDANNSSSTSSAANMTVAAPPAGTFAYVSNNGHTANGVSSDMITFTIKNSGTGTISGISANCSGASFYNFGNLATTTLAPNATVTVTCRAAASGGYYAAKVTMTGTNSSNSGVTFGPY